MFALVVAFVLALSATAAAQESAVPIVTVGQAVAAARARSPLRAGVAAAADGAAIAATLAGRPLNPFIDVRAENLAAPGPQRLDRDVFAVMSQPVELPGKRAARRELAGADRDAARLVVRTVERQIALDTMRAYMRGVRARDVLATLTEQRDGIGTLVATIKRRVEEGLAAEADLLRFEAEVARMTAEIARTDIELSRALQDLGSLIGAGAPIAPSQLVAPQAVPPPAPDEAALDSAVDRRPDILLAASRVDRANALAEIEQRQRLPDPTVSAGYKRTQGQNTVVAGVALSLPLFDRNAQARALAQAGVRAAAFDRDAAHASALAQARAAISAARSLAESLARVRRDLLVPAEGVRNAARSMFREGAADVLKLVDAERIYADVRREELALTTDAYVAAIEARFAVAQEDLP
jgi:outer membrane protein, heavy metal efflux system